MSCMKFEDYCRLKLAEEEGFDCKNNVIKIEQSEFLDEYCQIGDVTLEFYNTFDRFDNRFANLCKYLNITSLAILVLSFCILGFSLLLIASYNFFEKFGLTIVESRYLFWLIVASFIVVLISSIVTFIFGKKREKIYKILYARSIRYNNRLPSKESTLADYRIRWIIAKFGYENINYACNVFDENISYRDELDRAFTFNSFFSNFFVKGILTVLATGGLGFIGAYYANKLSDDSDINLIGISLFLNSFLFMFFILSFIALLYFLFIIIKDFFYEVLDLFVSNRKVTLIRKKRLSYFLHQSKVVKIKVKKNILK